MISLEKNRIPSGSWPFLLTIAASLRQLESVLASQTDLTEGSENILVTGEMNAYQQAMIRRALDLAGGTIACWNREMHISALVCSRALLETIATFSWFLDEASTAASKQDWERISKLVEGCCRSTSMPTAKNSLKSLEQPPRIGTVVKAFLKKTQPDAQPFWDQISNVAHPNGSPTMQHFGRIVDQQYVAKVKPDETKVFVAIYNSLYSCCWLNASSLDFDILAEEMRTGSALPDEHPLIERRAHVDKLVADLTRPIG